MNHLSYVSIKDWYRSGGANICDAITCAVEREIDMREKKVKEGFFDELYKKLNDMGIILTEIRQDSWSDGIEITAHMAPIEYNSLLMNKHGDFPAMKKGSRPHPKKVIFCGPATTILWKDGTKTTVKCQSEDVWSDEVGIAMCYLKKLLGNKGNYNNIFREAMKVAVVAEPKAKDTSSTITTGGSSYVTSAFDNMTENIDKINKCMKDAADALGKVVKEK